MYRCTSTLWLVIEIDPSSATPIWAQIESAVRDLVAARRLAPGDAVPSVRELARRLAINPATAAKAYQHLVAAGVLLVRRGEGTFVADGVPGLEPAERRQRLRGSARELAVLATTLGAARAEAHECLEESFDDLESRA